MFDYEQIAEIAKDNSEVYSVENFKFLESKLTRRPHPEYSEPCYIYPREEDPTGAGLYAYLILPEFRLMVYPQFFVWYGFKRSHPEGMALVQKCGDWLCCQPAHLEVITPTEYFLRIYDGRLPLPSRPHPNRRYDPREVFTVKFYNHYAELSPEILSEIMDIPKHVVRRLASYGSWRHIDREVIKMTRSLRIPFVNPYSDNWWYMNFREFIEQYELFKPVISTGFHSNEHPDFLSGALRRIQIVRERARVGRAE
jgi:hypothetical protein